MSSVDSHEELVVVGHACELLDNPERPLDIDGNILVPWGGDNSVLIDR